MMQCGNNKYLSILYYNYFFGFWQDSFFQWFTIAGSRNFGDWLCTRCLFNKLECSSHSIILCLLVFNKLECGSHSIILCLFNKLECGNHSIILCLFNKLECGNHSIILCLFNKLECDSHSIILCLFNKLECGSHNQYRSVNHVAVCKSCLWHYLFGTSLLFPCFNIVLLVWNMLLFVSLVGPDHVLQIESVTEIGHITTQYEHKFCCWQSQSTFWICIIFSEMYIILKIVKIVFLGNLWFLSHLSWFWLTIYVKVAIYEPIV
jgi:hypothetical protein